MENRDGIIEERTGDRFKGLERSDGDQLLRWKRREQRLLWWLDQIPHLRPAEYRRSRLPRNRRTVNRAYGGVLSGVAVRERHGLHVKLLQGRDGEIQYGYVDDGRINIVDLNLLFSSDDDEP
ncbi:hypothetical protein RJ640_001351 [Escallonia rubra]|uniref:Uncharacterized protein n=1 Tax=Escallonia rubra TaxID=112253 RepID=A0AA88R6L7_9ASTE|nr:hypothetical protein RJ640_001351 [Escallonia rubra]